MVSSMTRPMSSMDTVRALMDKYRPAHNSA